MAKEEMHVATLVGSLRRESWCRKAALALAACAPPHLKLDTIEIGGLPLFNQDDEPAPPQPWVEFRQRIRECDAVLFVTPEYNRSIPAALKNAVDVGSRPYGHSVWAGKPCAVISASPGPLGGFGANHHLRQCLVFLDMPVMQQPEAYVGRIDQLLDAQGGFTQEATREYFTRLMQAFALWAERFVEGRGRSSAAAASQ